MLRIIVEQVNVADAVHVSGAPGVITHHTFEIDAPDVEAFLREQPKYQTRFVRGVEVVEHKGTVTE